MGTLQDDLAAEAEALRQTHISWVFMHADRVLKVKKPVALGFLDFSTPELRRAACEAELRLNRRLAPDVYLALRPVIRDIGGRHRIGAPVDDPRDAGVADDTVDWAVEMRRLRDADAARERLRAGTLEANDVAAVARHIAAFHRGLRPLAAAEGHGDAAGVRRRVEENFDQSAPSVPAHVSQEAFEALRTRQRGFLDDHGERITGRLADGFVREGHGDLRLEHVYLAAGGIEIIDCVEFSEDLRCADVCSDLAFLAMDLRFEGAERLAEWLLSVYALHANDYGLYGLVDFYQSYRAHVRAKVSGISAGDDGQPAERRKRAAERAAAFFELSARCLAPRTGRPILVAVGGLIASGKSTVADAVASALGLPRVEADRTRKHLAGVGAQTPLGGAAFEGAYTPEATARTYAEVAARARMVLDSGRSVVVDASFRTQQRREVITALARETGARLCFVECHAPPSVCRARLAERAQGAHVSDGRLELFDTFARSYEAVTELDPGSHVRLDTSRPLEDNLARLLPQLRG